MIERDDDEIGFFVACDFCSSTVNIQQDGFMRAIEALKMRGWKIKRNYKDNSWLHQCPECKKKECEG